MATERKDTDQNKVDYILASTGYIFPRTESELENFNKLYPDEDYSLKDYVLNPHELTKGSTQKKSQEKLKFSSDKSSYFKRAVLGAEIACQLYEEPTFGHVKFQKLMFLCENIEGMNISYEYSKQAAGPYDNKLMHSIDYELKKQKWMEVKLEKKDTKSRYVFIPLTNFEGHKKYFKRYFNKNEERIQWFIDTFRKEKTDKVELIATLYACWMELISKKQIVSETSLLSLLYSWSKEKIKYSNEEALKAIQWMKDNSVIPL
ncbi:MAG: hypothetical protein QM786_06965 [Breznakibacter sp.]